MTVAANSNFVILRCRIVDLIVWMNKHYYTSFVNTCISAFPILNVMFVWLPVCMYNI